MSHRTWPVRVFLNETRSRSIAQAGCSGAIMVHGSLHLRSSDPPASASLVAGTVRHMPPHSVIYLFFFVETGSHFVVQAGLEFLTLNDPSTSA